MKFTSVNPPKLRTVLGEEDRTATWLELFYDLAFVVAVAVLGGRLAAAHSASDVFIYLGYFVLIWWLWASHTFYADRYDTDDVVYRILATVQLAAVAVIAASISSEESASTMAFAVGYTIARFALLAMYWRARRHVLETRILVNGYLLGHGIAASIWVISILVQEPTRYVLWAIALVIDLATPYLMRREQAKVPLDVSHLPERFGLFTILVLGESIAATVVGLSHHVWSTDSTFTGMMALVIATSIWWLYFDNVEGMVVRRDPGQRRAWRPTVWIYSHLGIAAGLGIVSVGLEHAIVGSGEGSYGDFDRWLLVIGASLTLASLALTHFASGTAATNRQHNEVAVARLVGAGLILVLGLFTFMTAGGVVLAIAVALVGTALVGVSTAS